MTISENDVKRMILLVTLSKLREHMKDKPDTPIYLCHVIKGILVDLDLWEILFPNEILIKPSENVFPSIYKHKLFLKDEEYENMWGWWARKKETPEVYNAKNVDCKKLVKKIHKQKEKYLLLLIKSL